MKKTVLREALALLLCAALCAGLLPAAYADGSTTQFRFRTPALGSAEYMNGAVELTWNAVTDAPRYGIFRSINGGPWRGLAVVVSLYYRDENVEPGVTYTYTVCCVSSDGRSILSPYDEKGLSVTVPTGMNTAVQVQTPVLIEAKNVSRGVQVSWEPVSGAYQYGIFRKTGVAEPWHGLAVSLSTSYTDETVVPGVTYLYTVCCLSPDGKYFQSAYDENGISVTFSTEMPVGTELRTPVLLDAKNVDRAVQVSWEPVSGAAQYGIFRRTEGGPWHGLAAVTETSYIDKGVEPDTTYSYTVCCLSADGSRILSPYDENGRTVRTAWLSEGGALLYVQPTDTSVKQMTYASFTARAAGSEVYYSWEMQAKDSAEWYTLPEIAWLIGGVNTDTLIVAAVLGLDGYSFRCRISDGQRAEYTKSVMLHVMP